MGPILTSTAETSGLPSRAGDFPEWELGLQLFDDAFVEKFDFDVLDATKLIPEELVPIKPCGADGPRSPGRQLFRRDRAGGLLHAERRARESTSADDPLLQGRNFSYLDTQVKRLGGPKFHPHPDQRARSARLPNFQQDGHMAMHNPKGRVNYEPNSWSETPGLANRPQVGYSTYPERIDAPKVREPGPRRLPTTTARPGSSTSARRPSSRRTSRTPLTFELSKVETVATSVRGWSGTLLNIDARIWPRTVAKGLRLKEMPATSEGRQADPSGSSSRLNALSIVKNGPKSVRWPEGRSTGDRRRRRGRS